jgi:VIT1/CCC1 family predicted Fe2+/Mn2+ transporter
MEVFWICIILAIVFAMLSEVFGKPWMKSAARWIFAGAIVLLLFLLLGDD